MVLCQVKNLLMIMIIKTNNYIQPVKIRIEKKDYYRIKHVTLEGLTIENWDFEIKDKEKEIDIKEKAFKKYNQLIEDESTTIKAEIT